MNNANAHQTPCEVCGKPSAWILARRLNSPNSEPGLRHTIDNPEAPKHPRCNAHSGDAWEMDGRTFDESRPR